MKKTNINDGWYLKAHEDEVERYIEWYRGDISKPFTYKYNTNTFIYDASLPMDTTDLITILFRNGALDEE